MDQGQINRIKQYLIVISRGVLVVLGVFFLILFSGIYVIDHVLPAPYSATSLIEVKPREVADSGTDSKQPVADNSGSWKAEAEVMKSPHLLWPVIQKLDLEKSWKDQLPPSKGDRESANEAITHLQEILKIEPKRGTDILQITASSDQPEESADIANAVVDRYKLERDHDETEHNEHEEDLINDQIDRQQQIIAEKKSAVEELRDGLEAKGIAIKPDTGKQELGELQIFHAAQRDLERQKGLLDAFTLHLRQVDDAATHGESPVRLLSRAEPPAPTSRPNRHFEMMLTLTVAILLSLGFACSVEVVFLLLRAAKRPEN
jgi:capsular polysaccharide biosynthesis protein